MRKNTVQRTLPIINRRGLHARAAAKFVNCAERFQAEIFVKRNGIEVPGRSIMGLMMLAATCGSQITITAEGEDAGQAVEEIGALFSKRCGELE